MKRHGFSLQTIRRWLATAGILLLVLGMIGVNSPLVSAQAFTKDNVDAINGDWTSYVIGDNQFCGVEGGVNAVNTGTSGGGGGGGSTGGTGINQKVEGGFYIHVKQAFVFLVSPHGNVPGYSLSQAAGIVGNLMQESGPKILPQDTDGIAHGIAQWQFGRLTGTKTEVGAWPWTAAWAASQQPQDPDGKDSFYGQLNYIIYDLEHYRTTISSGIRKLSDAREVANYWNAKYEISADKSATRGNNAVAILAAAQKYNWASGISVTPEPTDQQLIAGGLSCGDATATAGVGTVLGTTCASIGKASDKSDPRNPYVCESQEIKCLAGTDDGVGVGYAGGKPYHIRLCNVQGVIVNAFVSKNINDMIAAAATNGIKLTGVGGGFRTMDDQIRVRRQNHCPPDNLGPKDANGFYNQQTLIANEKATAPTSRCSPAAAPPGFSNHQMGLAVDWHANGPIIGSHGGAGWQWLNAHAKQFGFYNFPPEPWHWSVDGG